MSRILRIGIVAVTTGTLISGCGVGMGGLADGLDDAATPQSFMAPDGSDDGSGEASRSPFEGSTDDAEAASYAADGTASPAAESGDAIVAVGADGTTGGIDAPNDASNAVVDAPDATPAQTEASSGPADANEAAFDVSPDGSRPADASNLDGSRSDAADAGTDGNACMLPPGAATCCGAVACANHGGSCGAPGVCAQCEANCVNPALPICCALGGTIKCEAKLIDC